ncbi:MAG TPA: hypothetical protein VFH03_17535 [Actinoplanes sp.]|nr:hypothetical protein [Actinoplanes sp.]
MVVLSAWTEGDPPPGRLDVVRELVTVWAVHLYRSYRLIRDG